MLGDFTPLH